MNGTRCKREAELWKAAFYDDMDYGTVWVEERGGRAQDDRRGD
jgi:hypothetical protein